jgi:hypothetical protein
MKIQYSNKNTTKESKFPCLLIDPTDNTILLCTSICGTSISGTILRSDSDLFKPGEYSRCYSANAFCEEFKGTVTIES